MIVLCQGIVKKSNTRCTNPAKHFMPDGSAYCGRHISSPPPNQHLKELNLKELNLKELNLKEINLNEFDERNAHAKKLLIKVFLFVTGLVTRLFHLMVLIVLLFISHFVAKSYYFHHCESNLIKAWFFKRSSTCVSLSSFLNTVENLSFDGLSIIAKYCMMALGDFRHIFSG